MARTVGLIRTASASERPHTKPSNDRSLALAVLLGYAQTVTHLVPP